MKSSKFKTNNLFRICLLIVFSMMLVSCDSCYDPNPEPQLPAITMEGKNTFGCKINGEVWLPYKQFGDVSTGPILFYYYNTKKELYVGAQNTNYNEFIKLYASCPDTGKFNLTYKPGNDEVFFSKKSGQYHDYKLIDPSSVNTISILKLDTVNYIIAGTFEFTAYDPLHNDTIYIREGRFDIKYRE
jgi:hypothetical protein